VFSLKQLLFSDALANSSGIYTAAWHDFIAQSFGGEVARARGLLMLSGASPWPALNLAIVESPLESVKDLEQRVREASAFYHLKNRSWLMIACEKWTAKMTPDEIRRAFRASDMYEVEAFCGMAAEDILPPSRSAPALEYRAVDNTETEEVFGMINAQAYSTPRDWLTSAMMRNRIWSKAARAYVGYADGRPVSTAMVLDTRKTLYVAWIATLPSERRYGYAEAVMRHSLAEAQKRFGHEPMHLHATHAGARVYRRLGFAHVANFSMFLSPSDHLDHSISSVVVTRKPILSA